ncbi:cell division protein FtsA [Inconstantimicrobium mannanitabidum]|uniref:Cell division protein FtsA n=1 Tax=Inconstantimicrobium mannanitabidum TaxID=1604901 RepID=A0ACB5RCS5_9CLOT|nr:cell division FtsA domain-containing protein [Clostridium sp. TW13]GKX66875.1 cell division protein FtsA [Clostridium sp. TW13]
MNIENLSEREAIFSLDIGTRSIKGTVGVVRDKKFCVVAEKLIEHKERAMLDGQIHDIGLVADTVRNIKAYIEKEININLSSVSIAAAGRFLKTVEASYETDIDDVEIDKNLVRTVEMGAVKEAEAVINKQTNGKLYCVGYSVKTYYLNSYVISNLVGHKGEKIKVDVIATFLPRSVVDSLYSVMNKVNLKVENLTLEPIAALEAVIPQNLRLLNIALVDIGAGTSDIAICNNNSISAYGMVPLAGDEVTEAIAQAYLVDFITAERIKRQCSDKEEVTYTDILGLDNTIKSEDVLKVIEPVVDKMTNDVGERLLELNGGKAPSAVFLVGGGAHTQFFKEFIAKKLNLPVQRIAIKGREAVIDCVCDDMSIGSTGVTVLGIALVAIKNMGKDFIDVTLNDSTISLFNSHKHSVMDVLMNAQINPKVLIGKNGKNIRFMVNGIKRLGFGEFAVGAKILLNNIEATLESEVSNGDVIKVDFAQDGKDAAPKVMEYISEVDEKYFYYNEELINIEPIVKINNVLSQVDSIIKNNDDVEIIFPKTIGEVKKYVISCNDDEILSIGDIKLEDDYEIKNGDKIVTKNIYNEEKKETLINTDTTFIGEEDTFNPLKVIVNGKECILKNKKQYIFVDIFNFIDFDLQASKGMINLQLNGEKASYTDVLKENDIIKIFWE